MRGISRETDELLVHLIFGCLAVAAVVWIFF